MCGIMANKADTDDRTQTDAPLRGLERRRGHPHPHPSEQMLVTSIWECIFIHNTQWDDEEEIRGHLESEYGPITDIAFGLAMVSVCITISAKAGY